MPHVLQAQQAGLNGQGAETRAIRDKKIPGVLAWGAGVGLEVLGSQAEGCVPWPPSDAEILQCRPYPLSWVPAVSSENGVCWT